MKCYFLVLLLMTMSSTFALGQKFKYETPNILGKKQESLVLPALLLDRPKEFTYKMELTNPELWSKPPVLNYIGIGGFQREGQTDYTFVLVYDAEPTFEVFLSDGSIRTLAAEDGAVKGKFLNFIQKIGDKIEGKHEHTLVVRFHATMALHIQDASGQTIYKAKLLDEHRLLRRWIDRVRGEREWVPTLRLDPALVENARFKTEEEATRWLRDIQPSIQSVVCRELEEYALYASDKVIRTLFAPTEIKSFVTLDVAEKLIKHFPEEVEIATRAKELYTAWASNPDAKTREELKALATRLENFVPGERKDYNFFYYFHRAVCTLLAGDKDRSLLFAQRAYESEPIKLSFKLKNIRPVIQSLYDDVLPYLLLKEALRDNKLAETADSFTPLVYTIYISKE